MSIEHIGIGTKALGLTKAVNNSNFSMKTVLTLDPFNYVDLWLRRERKEEALHYWRQSRDFHRAAQGLPIESAPLVLYYCFMNAAKALLSAKGITFDPRHGVGPHRMRGPNSKVVLSNEGIGIRPNGIVPALAGYFNEPETRRNHSLEDVLYNLIYIHRTYCLSYPKRKERFLPLKNLAFCRDSISGNVRLLAEIVEGVDWNSYKTSLPTEVEPAMDGSPSVQSVSSIQWTTASRPTDAELESLQRLNSELRRVFHYINGSHTLWYLKTSGSYEIRRSPLTLTLSAMHRLSEICRYKPSELRSFLDGQKNWLLSEFVAMAAPQFLDEIACEMTGHQIMIPNVRTPV
ncbi:MULTISPECIES: YaaC family protein [unclassified Bradyrhizobium]|uniref:YaaC family protein n=1 Tax=unclassified Bradyrhizobium TaxID=2631580 RepID=UPI002916E035|nr:MULTISPECIES: YaaC family protein [unclassified Bradyrhizobium]